MLLKTLCSASLLLTIIITVFTSCKSSNGKDKAVKTDTIPKIQPDITLPGNFSTQTSLKFDSSAIPAFFSKYPKLMPYEKELLTFYSHRKFAYAWFDNNGMIEQAGNLFNKIENISDEGVPVQILYEE